MTIIVHGVKWVVIVLPARLDSEVVRVDHMIVCVYRAVWEWIVECHGEFGGRWGEKKRSSSGSSYRVIDIEEFGGDIRGQAFVHAVGRGTCMFTGSTNDVG